MNTIVYDKNKENPEFQAGDLFIENDNGKTDIVILSNIGGTYELVSLQDGIHYAGYSNTLENITPKLKKLPYIGRNRKITIE